jgi:hypothetical protein
MRREWTDDAHVHTAAAPHLDADAESSPVARPRADLGYEHRGGL